MDHKDRLTGQSRIWNPITQRQDVIQSHDTNDPDLSLKKHYEFVEFVKNNNYLVPQKKELEAKYVPQFVLECAQYYLDYLQDIGVAKHKRKNLSDKYIYDQERYIKRFLQCLKEHEIKPSTFYLTNLGDTEVEYFCDWLDDFRTADGKPLTETGYNHHIDTMRYMVGHFIKKHGVDMYNPFQDVKKRTVLSDPTIITEEQLEIFLNTITPENGVGKRGKETANFYRPWLKSAFLLFVMIGDRRGGMVELKWKDYQDNFFGVPNWKVNKAKKDGSRHYISWTPVTLDLAEVLLSIGPEEPDDYIIAPDRANRYTLALFLTKAFKHYWDKSGNKTRGNITLHSLRKTYITKVIDLLGEKAGFMKHADLQTVKKHYADQKEIFRPLQGKRMFGFDLSV